MKYAYIYIVAQFLAISCDQEAPCELFYIPKEFVGKIRVYYNQRNGQRLSNHAGCKMHSISDSGECNSAWPYELSGRILRKGKTLRFFQVDGSDTTQEIFEYSRALYLEDVNAGIKRKYVSYFFGGIQDDKDVYGFSVNYGDFFEQLR